MKNTFPFSPIIEDRQCNVSNLLKVDYSILLNEDCVFFIDFEGQCVLFDIKKNRKKANYKLEGKILKAFLRNPKELFIIYEETHIMKLLQIPNLNFIEEYTIQLPTQRQLIQTNSADKKIEKEVVENIELALLKKNGFICTLERMISLDQESEYILSVHALENNTPIIAFQVFLGSKVSRFTITSLKSEIIVLTATTQSTGNPIEIFIWDYENKVSKTISFKEKVFGTIVQTLSWENDSEVAFLIQRNGEYNPFLVISDWKNESEKWINLVSPIIGMPNKNFVLKEIIGFWESLHILIISVISLVDGQFIMLYDYQNNEVAYLLAIDENVKFGINEDRRSIIVSEYNKSKKTIEMQFILFKSFKFLALKCIFEKGLIDPLNEGLLKRVLDKLY